MEFPCKGQVKSWLWDGSGRGITRRLRSLHSERGGSLVEFAVTLPMLMLVMTGIFSVSTAIYQKMELTEAVSDGGRFLAIDRGDTDPCKTTAGKIAAAAPTLNSGGITYSFSINGGTSTGASCTGNSGANNMTSGGTASVTASYTCSIRAYNYIFPGTCSLSSSITEEVQ